MERRAKVELFEQIRREYEFGVGTIRGVARQLGVHRRRVRQALKEALPPERKGVVRASPKLGPVREFIDRILEADRKAPRKQRHAARRIYVRIGQEFPGHPIAEVTVREYVRARKHELGLSRRETFIPQCYTWREEAQVDWYEATAQLGGGLEPVQVFAMRSMASGGENYESNDFCTYRNGDDRWTARQRDLLPTERHRSTSCTLACTIKCFLEGVEFVLCFVCVS
jgi:hypothetical protein